MNKDFQKLITRLQDEGISQYGITLLEGFAIDLENKIEIAKKSVQCNSCEKKINDNSHLTFCTECSGYSNHVSDKMNDFAFAQLNELCQMVERGAKPVALISIRVPEYQKAIDIIYKEYSLHAIGKQLNESFFSIFIFKNYDLRFVLDLLPDEPKIPTDHALLGYLFGYDTDSICKYIFKNCELNEPNLM